MTVSLQNGTNGAIVICKLKTLWQKLGQGNQKHMQHDNAYDKSQNTHKNTLIGAQWNADFYTWMGKTKIPQMPCSIIKDNENLETLNARFTDFR
jgi:hypothetical protein